MSSQIRKYILLTLSHAENGERAHYTPHFVSGKCRSLFDCKSVIVGKELHKDSGYHYHVGILNDTASYHTATKKLRDSFQEFDGRQLNVSFHKSWNTICDYILKQDSDPFCWGTTKEQLVIRLSARKGHKKSTDLINRLRNCETWDDVLQDSILGARVLKSYSSVKHTFNDLKRSIKLPSVESRLKKVVLDKEKFLSVKIKPYTELELRSHTNAVYWLVRNLSNKRDLQQPQLFILGGPESDRSSFVDVLRKNLVVYDLPARKDDFSMASTNADLWVMDEFEPDFMSPPILNRILAGQSILLDSKYSEVFLKNKNMPVILASHIIPRYKNKLMQRAFESHLEFCEFLPNERLNGDRLLKTLWLLIEQDKKLGSEYIFLEKLEE